MAKSKPEQRADQVAAVPIHIGPDGEIEVLVVTSRDTGRWIVPKGWPIKDKKPWEAAAQEAFEEAGVSGTMSNTPLGTYKYDKWVSKNESIPCLVTVYAMAVDKKHKSWPEDDERRRRWLSPERAAKRVIEPELKAILLGLEKKLAA